MTFTLRRQSAELVFRTATLQRRAWLTPGYVRLHLAGDELRGFSSAGADDHLRLFFAETADADNPRGASREYTPLRWDSEAGTLDIEFVVHGDEGVAGPWAARAPLGSTVGVGGPRGSMVIDGRPAWWLLAGDESALPAIRRFVGQMDADAIGLVLIEVADAGHEQPLAVPAGVELRWLHRAGDRDGAGPADGPAARTTARTAEPGTALRAALDGLGAEDRPGTASGFVFIAAEQSIVKPGRALALERWGVDAACTVIKGYWKRGETEYHAPH